jgi:hypothetical protein
LEGTRLNGHCMSPVCRDERRDTAGSLGLSVSLTALMPDRIATRLRGVATAWA